VVLECFWWTVRWSHFGSLLFPFFFLAIQTEWPFEGSKRAAALPVFLVSCRGPLFLFGASFLLEGMTLTPFHFPPPPRGCCPLPCLFCFGCFFPPKPSSVWFEESFGVISHLFLLFVGARRFSAVQNVLSSGFLGWVR